MRVSLNIKDRSSWIELFHRFKKAGFMSGMTEEDVDLEDDQFPIEFFIEIDPLFKLIESPIAKPFRKKIDSTLSACVEEAINEQQSGNYIFSPVNWSSHRL